MTKPGITPAGAVEDYEEHLDDGDTVNADDAKRIHALLLVNQARYRVVPNVEDVHAYLVERESAEIERRAAYEASRPSKTLSFLNSEAVKNMLQDRTLEHEIWKALFPKLFVAVDATPEGSELRVTDLVTVRKDD